MSDCNYHYFLLMKHLNLNKWATDELDIYERDLIAKRIREEFDKTKINKQ